MVLPRGMDGKNGSEEEQKSGKESNGFIHSALPDFAGNEPAVLQTPLSFEYGCRQPRPGGGFRCENSYSFSWTLKTIFSSAFSSIFPSITLLQPKS